MSPAILESWELKEMGDFHPDLFTSCLSFRASCSFLDFSLIRPIVQSLPVLTSAFLEILHWTCPESYANLMHLVVISLFLSLHLLRQLLKLCLAIVAKIKIKSKLSALEFAIKSANLLGSDFIISTCGTYMYMYRPVFRHWLPNQRLNVVFAMFFCNIYVLYLNSG